jgi:hypothetical protein
VHRLQLVTGELPFTEHDFGVDVIALPDKVIACGPRRRPPGVVEGHLTDAIVAAIPRPGPANPQMMNLVAVGQSKIADDRGEEQSVTRRCAIGAAPSANRFAMQTCWHDFRCGSCRR